MSVTKAEEPLDRGDGSVFGAMDVSMEPGPQPVWWWLTEEVAQPDQPALLSGEGHEVSRLELSRAVRAAARFLCAQGVGRDDRLVLSCAPGPNQAVALLACMAVAAVAPLNPTGPAAAVKEDLQRLRATCVVVDDSPSPVLLQVAETLGLPVLHLDLRGLPTVPVGWLPPWSGERAVALLMQTSGTTSRPKVVPLSHGNLLAGARAIAGVLSLGPSDRTLAAMSLFHIHGVVATLLAPLIRGGSVVCCHERAPDRLLEQLTTLRPTWLSAAPTLLLALLDAVEKRGRDPVVHHLRLIRSVTMPLAAAVRARLESVFRVPVLAVYGMTEASSQVCSQRLPERGGCHRGWERRSRSGPRVDGAGFARAALSPGRGGRGADSRGGGDPWL